MRAHKSYHGDVARAGKDESQGANGLWHEPQRDLIPCVPDSRLGYVAVPVVVRRAYVLNYLSSDKTFVRNKTQHRTLDEQSLAANNSCSYLFISLFHILNLSVASKPYYSTLCLMDFSYSLPQGLSGCCSMFTLHSSIVIIVIRTIVIIIIFIIMVDIKSSFWNACVDQTISVNITSPVISSLPSFCRCSQKLTINYFCVKINIFI